jgi:hypothetical protein
MHTAVFREQVPTLTTKYSAGLPTFFGRPATRKNFLLWLPEYEAQVQGGEDGNNKIKYTYASHVLTKDSF